VIKINLAPPVEQGAGRHGAPGVNLGLVFAGTLAALLVGLGIWWSILSADVGRLTREIGVNQGELDRLSVLIAEHQRHRRDKEDLERRVHALEIVAQGQSRPASLMAAVASAVPADVHLTRMEERARRVRLAGVAASSIALSDFMSNLETSGKFRDVDLLESRRDLARASRTITFEVSARFGA
jgi:Tfp pilus assembly protein PilN